MRDRYSVDAAYAIEESDLFLPKVPRARYMIQHACHFLQYKMAAPVKMIHSVAARANVVGGIPVYNTKPAVRNATRHPWISKHRNSGKATSAGRYSGHRKAIPIANSNPP